MSRDRVVSVRVTDAEYERLSQRADAAGRSVSEHIRDVLLREPPSSIEWILGYGGRSITVPSGGNVIWLSGGHADGNTLTVAA